MAVPILFMVRQNAVRWNLRTAAPTSHRVTRVSGLYAERMEAPPLTVAFVKRALCVLSLCLWLSLARSKGVKVGFVAVVVGEGHAIFATPVEPQCGANVKGKTSR